MLGVDDDDDDVRCILNQTTITRLTISRFLTLDCTRAAFFA